jgi:hypothetical protein
MTSNSRWTTTTNVVAITAIGTTRTTRTTMTSERRDPKREARFRVTAFELRLYVAAFLAAVYAISLRAIGGHAPATEPTPVAAPIAGASQQRFVWLGSVPPETRPAIALPAGWEIVSERADSSSPRPHIVRTPNRRVPRVRTRSS